MGYFKSLKYLSRVPNATHKITNSLYFIYYSLAFKLYSDVEAERSVKIIDFIEEIECNKRQSQSFSLSRSTC